MRNTEERQQLVKDFIRYRKVVAFKQVFEQVYCSELTLRNDIGQIGGITSYTHQRSFITLGDTPSFDQDGIWFFRDIGFTKYESSLNLIIHLIDSSKSGMTREQIQEIMNIQIHQQIQILLKRKKLHRVKIGKKYCYLPKLLAKDKKQRFGLLDANNVEEYYDARVNSSDLIALLKAVLNEKEIKIDVKTLKYFAQKYCLKIPLEKIEQLLLKYNLTEKKTPSD